MQDNIVVGWVMVVAVTIPIGAASVYLHVAYPVLAVNDDVSVEKVRTGILVVQSNRENPHRPAVNGMNVC